MSFFKKKKDVIGLDIGSNSIKLVQLAETKKNFKLVKLGIMQLQPQSIADGNIVNHAAVTNAIKELISHHGIKVKDVVSALTGNSVIIKKVNLSVMTEDELAESIQWEAEQYIPFPINEVNIDFQILGQDDKGTMDVVLVAVKKDVINDYVHVIKGAEMNPTVIDVDSFALENMFEANYPTTPDEDIIIINIGAAVMSVTVLKGGVTVFTRAVAMGGNLITYKIQKLLNISFKDAEMLKIKGQMKGMEGSMLKPVIDESLDDIAQEIKKSVDFYLSGAMGGYVNRIYLSGGCSKTKGLSDRIREVTGLPVETINPFKGVEYDRKSFDPKYIEETAPLFAVAVGIAMRMDGNR
ncbi:MAG: type IV pilus assembly protein PilM [Deltaproteobacteria bacterium]|nr:type IV pilus assembly protein PilM [Deltaproteobacteria bacterium]